MERDRPSLGLILEKTPEVISLPRSSKRVERHVDHESGSGVEIAQALLVSTSPCEPGRGSHGASDTSADRG